MSNGIVHKLWNYCDVLRNDRLAYGDYVSQLYVPALPQDRRGADTAAVQQGLGQPQELLLAQPAGCGKRRARKSTTDDRKPASACKDFGLQNIQYSCFREKLSQSKREELYERMRRVQRDWEIRWCKDFPESRIQREDSTDFPDSEPSGRLESGLQNRHPAPMRKRRGFCNLR